MTSDILKRAAEAVKEPHRIYINRAMVFDEGVTFTTVAGLYPHAYVPEDSYIGLRTLIPDMAAAIAERDEQIKRLTARAEAADAMADRLAEAVIGAQNIVLHCDITDGSCCCGEDMAQHSSQFVCGHQPIDHGRYYADKWLEGSVDLIASHAAMKEGR